MNQSDLERKLRITFHNKDLLRQALTHRSFLNENKDWPVGQNERLELLGDAVIQLVVTEFLFAEFPEMQEGEITALRAKLVCAAAFHGVAQEFNLFDYVHFSRGQRRDRNHRVRERLVSSAFEALVGALHLDRGYSVTAAFLDRVLLSRTEQMLGKTRDPKSKLQEKTQALLKITPTYRVLEESGPDHDKRFVVGVFFSSTLIAKGYGSAKKLAEEKAAEAALILKGWARSPIHP